jgi:hypothetical protein
MGMRHLGSGKACPPRGQFLARTGQFLPRRGHTWPLMVLVVAACTSPPSWIREATPEPAVAPTSEAIEGLLLHEIAERLCPFPDTPGAIDYYTTEGGAYSFVCYPATGHSVTVTLQRFPDPAGAEVGFQAAPGIGPIEELDGFPVTDWQEQHPSFPGGRAEYRLRLMQVGQWLIGIRSFDDTHFLIAPDPHEASLAILQVFREHGLPHTAGEPP